VRYVILAAASAAVMFGDEITLPLDDGNILISARFIRVNGYGGYAPELALKLKNQTSAAWRRLKVQFDIGGLCNGNPANGPFPSAPAWDGPKVIRLSKNTRTT